VKEVQAKGCDGFFVECDLTRDKVESHRRGFHCSESVFLAINGALDIIDPGMVRAMTGFHGGGGAHPKEPKLNLNAGLEEVASGRGRRPLEELSMAVTGNLCVALASGTVCIGLLFGRLEATDDLTCVDELSYELHRRFETKYGLKTCRKPRKRYVSLSSSNFCEHIYQEGARMAVELILEAPELVDCYLKRG